MLRDHGRLPLRDVLEPAIHYARHGHPLLPRVAGTIAGLSEFFRDEWPTSHAVLVRPAARSPRQARLFRNEALADTWARLLTEAEAASGREAQVEAARRTFRQGFIAEAIDAWMRDACVMDAAGGRRKGVLTGHDMAGWEATYEAPLTIETEGLGRLEGRLLDPGARPCCNRCARWKVPSRGWIWKAPISSTA